MAARHDYFRRECARRGITTLFHFTPLDNVPSILSHGLMPRTLLAELDDPDLRVLITDDQRLDGNLDALSLSIHSLNESMFAKKRETFACDWAIIAIDAEVLWTHKCLFCWQNAASRSVRCWPGYLGGYKAFDRLFEDKALRAERGIPDNQPTNNDAEVQVCEAIYPELIDGVIVAREDQKAEIQQYMSKIGHIGIAEANPACFQ